MKSLQSLANTACGYMLTARMARWLPWLLPKNSAACTKRTRFLWIRTNGSSNRGCLLYRDPEIARTTFTYTGAYAKQLSADPIEGFAFFEESIELSRRFRGLKLWLSLRYHGLEGFRAAIRGDLDHAQQLARNIDADARLERLAPVELSAVCFRHVVRKDASEEERNRFNLGLLKRLIARGRVYLSNAELKGKFCLRACIVNHRTTDADIDAVV